MRAGVLAAALAAASVVAVTVHAAPPERQHGARAGQEIAVDGYVTIGKPTAPIAVTYELGSEPALGQPLTVRILAQAAAEVTNVNIELSADEALHLGPLARAGGSAATDHVWTLTVTPLREGLGQLNVSVTGRVDGQDQTRSVLIPIRTAIATAGGDAAQSDKAERVISLPAEER